MFKGISWSSYLLFMLVVVVLYYVVVGFMYYRPELMALIQGKGKAGGGAGTTPKAPAQPVLVATGSAFAEQEEVVVPTPEPHLPAAAVAAAAALAAAGAEKSEAQEAKDPTMDDGTGKVLSSDDAAVADEYENPTEDPEEAERIEAKRLLELGKQDSSNPNSIVVVEGSDSEDLNQSEGNSVENTHNITKFTDNESEESDSAMSDFVEPVDLNDDAEPLEMIQVEDELEVSDTLIGAGDLSNLLDSLATGEIGAEELAEVAPVFSGTELSTRFAANKKRRNQEIESMFDDE